MPEWNEEFLQFIWRHRLWKPTPFITQSGKEITILKPGELNTDAGPDFFNAHIRLDGVVLVGNIELHMRSSDWIKHKHQNDASYDTIILHVVYRHDADIAQNTDHQVEILELEPYLDKNSIAAYRHLISTPEKLPCAPQLRQVDDMKLWSWLERMTIERLEEKVKRLENYFEANGRDYTQTFYWSFLRSFGFKVNALPFELLAKQLPVHLLLKHSDNLFQLEALFLGMAGMLEQQLEDTYMQHLQNEFTYLRAKYSLIPLKKELFKFSRMRPANFPDLRLIQLAAFMHQHRELFMKPGDKTNYSELMKVLQIKPQSRWKQSEKQTGLALEKVWTFGKASAENLLINTFAPFFFFYSRKLHKPEYTNATLELLNACKAEVNAKTKLFQSRKDILVNAGGSQALIHLYDQYCSQKKCLKCGIAAAILSPARESIA